mgnify:CR=1 FL=1
MNKKTMLKGCAVLALGLMMAQCNGNKQTSAPVATPATGVGRKLLLLLFIY